MIDSSDTNICLDQAFHILLRRLVDLDFLGRVKKRFSLSYW